MSVTGWCNPQVCLGRKLGRLTMPVQVCELLCTTRDVALVFMYVGRCGNEVCGSLMRCLLVLPESPPAPEFISKLERPVQAACSSHSIPSWPCLLLAAVCPLLVLSLPRDLHSLRAPSASTCGWAGAQLQGGPAAAADVPGPAQDIPKPYR